MAINAKAQNQITSPKKLPSMKLMNALATEPSIIHIIKVILFIVFLQVGSLGTTLLIYNASFYCLLYIIDATLR